MPGSAALERRLTSKRVAQASLHWHTCKRLQASFSLSIRALTLSETRSRHHKRIRHGQHGVQLGLLGHGWDELARQPAPNLQEGRRKELEI